MELRRRVAPCATDGQADVGTAAGGVSARVRAGADAAGRIRARLRPERRTNSRRGEGDVPAPLAA